MYPLCCIDIRNFLNQFYFFSDDHFRHLKVIDDTLKSVRVASLCPSRLALYSPRVRSPSMSYSVRKFATHYSIVLVLNI